MGDKDKDEKNEDNRKNTGKVTKLTDSKGNTKIRDTSCR